MSRPRHRRQRLALVSGWLVSLVATSSLAAVLAARATGGAWWWVAPLAAATVWHRWMRRETGVPVLMYHSVSADSSWLPWAQGISMTPETFERQLSILARHRFSVISSRDLLDARRDGRPLPPRPVVLHFDDGYLDNWVAALPALRRHGMPATLFVSLDFIEPGEEPRPNLDDVAAGRLDASELRWDGYLNWGELRAMVASGLVEIGAHGVDHGRVVTGPRVVDRVTPQNWRRLAWVQWAAMPGPKWHWYRHDHPPAVSYGTEVRESAPALSAPAWSGGRREPQGDYESRVRRELTRCREELRAALGNEVALFCWPQNLYSERARELAAQVGYRGTAAGDEGENRPGDSADITFRVHSAERALGVRCPLADDLAFYAKLRTHQGNYYWAPVLLVINAVHRIVAGRRRPPGSRGSM